MNENASPGRLWVFIAATFLGAFLLFQVEPMIAKQIAPRLGGTPQVWVTSMLFFQVTLLAGYAFAHLVVLGRRRRGLQLVVVCIPIVLALLTLPIGLPDDWLPPVLGDPSGWLFVAMGVAIGLPFFTLAATSPLLQAWFSATGHRSSRDPYFLYAASNLGSLVGLLSYPILVEPSIDLTRQFSSWSLAYAAYAALLIGCGVAFLRSARRSAEDALPDQEEDEEPEPRLGTVTWKRRLRWLALAFLPSSLLLGSTSVITTDLVAVPLLWVLPLSLYLVSFIVVFGKRHNVERAANVALPILALSYFLVYAIDKRQPLFALVTLVLMLFFAAAVVCHGRLAADRPATEKLTEYFLIVALGGALGGVFNALVAPILFDLPYEFHIAIVLACFFRVQSQTEVSRADRLKWRAAPVALSLLPLFVILGLDVGEQNPGVLLEAAVVGIPALILLLLAGRWPKLFAATLTLFATVVVSTRGDRIDLIFLDRNFFGSVKVIAGGPDDVVHMVAHGTTIHGRQILTEDSQCIPISYYFPTGPGGAFLTAYSEGNPDATVGVVGLGAGTMAAFSKPTQDWTFYEIDPLMARIAQDPTYFTFLSECIDDYELVMGDGRRSIAREPQGKFDLLVFDAFSSDAIPMHLVTKEALALYGTKLAEDGVMLFNITNNYLNLEPVLGNVAAADGYTAHHWDEPFLLSGNEERAGKLPSRWMVVTKQAQRPEAMQIGAWTQVGTYDAPLWTDDFSNLFGVMIWEK